MQFTSFISGCSWSICASSGRHRQIRCKVRFKIIVYSKIGNVWKLHHLISAQAVEVPFASSWNGFSVYVQLIFIKLYTSISSLNSGKESASRDEISQMYTICVHLQQSACLCRVDPFRTDDRCGHRKILHNEFLFFHCRLMPVFEFMAAVRASLCALPVIECYAINLFLFLYVAAQDPSTAQRRFYDFTSILCFFFFVVWCWWCRCCCCYTVTLPFLNKLLHASTAQT